MKIIRKVYGATRSALLVALGCAALLAVTLPSTAHARWGKDTQGPQPGDPNDPDQGAVKAAQLRTTQTNTTGTALITMTTYGRATLIARLAVHAWLICH